jgi:hypothetical protein
MLLGTATAYSLPLQPLRCGDIFTTTHEWIAVDLSLYLTNQVQCGDTMLLTTPHGSIIAPALDAGYLHAYHVEQWGPQPIIADVPAHVANFPGLSTSPVTLINLSALERRTRYGLRR